MLEKLISAGAFGLINAGWGYILGIFACAIAGYLIGSVSFTTVFAEKAGCEPNVTSMVGTRGVGYTLAALSLDLLKGAVCSLVGLLLMPGDGFMGVCGLFGVIGQCKPLYRRFRGGEAFPVAIGASLVMNPVMAAACAIIGFCMYAVSGYVSLGALAASCIFPFIARRLPLWVFIAPGEQETLVSLVNTLLDNLTPIALAIAVLFAYASNLGRMMAGDEDKLPLKRKNLQK